MTRRDALSAALVAALGTWLYRGALSGGFVGDDALLVHYVTTFGGLAHPGRYFTFDFFEYYRPLSFLTIAADLATWGERPWGLHATSVGLHCLNAALVYLLACRVLPPAGAALAATLFVTHFAAQEAVYWISGRFDLLATTLGLAALLAFSSRLPSRCAAGHALFFAALLAKESALAIPVIALAWHVFVAGSSRRTVAALAATLLGVVAVYAALRSSLGGLAAAGGLERLPKLAGLVAAVAVLAWLGGGRWRAIGRHPFWRGAGPRAAVAGGIATLVLAAAWWLGHERTVADRLNFAGYAARVLLVPGEPGLAGLEVGGPLLRGLAVAATTLVAFALAASWRHWVENPVWWWLGASLVGCLLPVSSMIEGSRYFYLATVPLSIGIARAAFAVPARLRLAPALIVALFLWVSASEVRAKAADWQWAGRMTEEAVRVVAAARTGCGRDDLVFLVAPVDIRNVYGHFYHQTFALFGQCEPRSYQAMVRAVGGRPNVTARWEAGRAIGDVEPGGAVLIASSDLRRFDRVLAPAAGPARLTTPVGTLDVIPDASRFTFTFEPDRGRPRPLIFYFDGQRIVFLPTR